MKKCHWYHDLFFLVGKVSLFFHAVKKMVTMVLFSYSVFFYFMVTRPFFHMDKKVCLSEKKFPNGTCTWMVPWHSHKVSLPLVTKPFFLFVGDIKHIIHRKKKGIVNIDEEKSIKTNWHWFHYLFQRKVTGNITFSQKRYLYHRFFSKNGHGTSIFFLKIKKVPIPFFKKGHGTITF